MADVHRTHHPAPNSTITPTARRSHSAVHYRSSIRPFTPATARPSPSGDPPDLTLWGDESGRASRRA